MIPDLTLEVIYINQPTDFKMEFELCGSSNVRFLSVTVKDRNEFLSVISKSVVRSRAIIAVGSFNPLDKLYVPKIISKAIGYELKAVEKEKFGITAQGEIFLPEKALPLVDNEGNVAGCVLENRDQSIILLTNDKELRYRVVKDLVCPYLKLFANKKTEAVSNTQTFRAISKNNLEDKEILNNDTETNKTVDAVEIQTDSSDNSEEKADNGIETIDAAEDTDLNIVEQNTETEIQTNSEQEVESPAYENYAETGDNKADKQAYNTSDDIEKDKPVYAVLEQPQVFEGFNLSEFLIDDPLPENSRKKSRPWIKIIISIVLVIVVLFLTYFGYEHLYQPMQKNSVYEETREMYGQTWVELSEDMLYKFGKLYQTNSDIFGWLNIPDTNINLPVVSSANKSEFYYRNHLFEGSLNRYGTLYTPSSLTSGNFVRNTIIYGKDTDDGTMLSELKKYLDIEHYQKVPTFSFDTLYLENKWKIFSVFKVTSAKEEKYLKNNFFDDAEFSEYVELLKSVSLIDTNIDVSYNDQLVTLVAQNEDINFVVSARKVRSGESPLVDVTGTSVNDEALFDSSTVPAMVQSDSYELVEISSEEAISSVDSTDNNMADGVSSRFEQHAPLSSTIIIKPTAPVISSAPEISSVYEASHTSSAETSEAIYNETSLVDSTVTSNITSSPSSTQSSGISSELDSTSSSTSSSLLSSMSDSSLSTQSKEAVTSKQEQNKNNNTSQNVSSTLPNAEKLPVLTVTNDFNGQKTRGPANEILAMILEAEMGSGYHIEALKAQAVAAYSWLLCNGSANGQYPNAPMKTPEARCIEAANAVAGQVAVYKGSVAQTFYYAISAGRTAYSKDIWSNQLPYLVSVDSSVDKSVNGYQTVRKYSSSTVAKIAKELLNVDLTKISNKSNWFKCTYDSNGLYCTKIKIGGVEQKGTYMRDTFFAASRVGASNVLRSSAYTIEYSKKEDKFTFTVKGYGHGVGMSQVGANAYAKKGWNYEKILKHYYQGITIGTYFNN